MSSYGLKNLGVKAGPVFTVLYYFEGPGVIVELGYLTNDKDYRYLTSAGAKQEMATAITNAIISYFEALDGAQQSVEQPAQDQAEEQPQQSEQSEQSEQPQLSEGYTIQLLSSSVVVDANDSQFKSYKGKVRELIGEGSYKYKYCYGSYATRDEARQDLETVRTSFKDAYIVKFKDDKIVK
jgi:N-acetylmuramoyl-L-alanine amidase